jgi:phosphatidate cytidylyltransferase
MLFASFAGANAATAPLSAIAERRRNLADRVLSGLVLGPIVIALVVLGGPVFELSAAAAAGIGLREWLKMATGAAPIWSLVLPAALVAAFWAGGLLIAFALLALATLGLALRGAKLASSRGEVAFGLPYVAVSLLALVWLRDTNGGGWPLAMFALLMVWATDIGAFFAGRTLGGPR